MTKLTKNAHKSKELFLKEIESLNSNEAKALLPFLEKYSPLTAFRALENITTLPKTGGKKWFHLLYIQRQFLDLYSYENNLGIHWTNRGLESLVEPIFWDVIDGSTQRAIEWYLKKTCAGSEESKLKKGEAELIFSFLNACHYYHELQYSKDKSTETYLKSFI